MPIGLVGVVLGLSLILAGVGAGPVIGGTLCVLTWWAFRRSPWTTPVERGAPLLSRTAIPAWQLAIISSVFLAGGFLLLLRREQSPISGPTGDVIVWIAAACGIYLGVRGLSWLSAAGSLTMGMAAGLRNRRR